MSDKLWFHAKRYGFGWTPATWEGWAVTAGYTAAIVAWIAYLLASRDATIGWHLGAASWIAALPLLVLTTALLAICWLKGERPRWRWGK